MQNKLSDLNNHLFETIEFLGDRSIKGEDLKEEAFRAEKICKVASQVISAGRLAVDAARLADELSGTRKLPPLLE
jgi:hypothetical protein